ncbi:hypothetical protein B0F90DRAFT_1920978 [Multifurca ochricompacta]|uniref:Uncharacterized protein n=1 Tax=Multifurca ochricompacta TaxID=376703 RepID=A0AAD4LUF7_9AGAM|nr:hypothetical protein B0F90DRAFT_1920978 [Multifurca ochricompacta]
MAEVFYLFLIRRSQDKIKGFFKSRDVRGFISLALTVPSAYTPTTGREGGKNYCARRFSSLPSLINAVAETFRGFQFRSLGAVEARNLRLLAVLLRLLGNFLSTPLFFKIWPVARARPPPTASRTWRDSTWLGKYARVVQSRKMDAKDTRGPIWGGHEEGGGGGGRDFRLDFDLRLHETYMMGYI